MWHDRGVSYSSNHIAMYKYQIKTLYTLNSVLCQLYLNFFNAKKNTDLDLTGLLLELKGAWYIVSSQ